MMEDYAKIAVAFIIVALPALLFFCMPLLKRLIDLREKRLEIDAGMTAEKAAQYVAHNERLEQRVRVLERIITDKGVVVSDEIEKLRDEPLN